MLFGCCDVVWMLFGCCLDVSDKLVCWLWVNEGNHVPVSVVGNVYYCSSYYYDDLPIKQS